MCAQRNRDIGWMKGTREWGEKREIRKNDLSGREDRKHRDITRPFWFKFFRSLFVSTLLHVPPMQHPLVQRSQRRLQNIVCPEHPLIVPETRVPSRNCLSPVFRPEMRKYPPSSYAIITVQMEDIKPTGLMKLWNYWNKWCSDNVEMRDIIRNGIYRFVFYYYSPRSS